MFNYLDHDGDGHINYKEFCGFTEEKRRGIDPFDADDNKVRLEQSNRLQHITANTNPLNPYEAETFTPNLTTSSFYGRSSS